VDIGYSTTGDIKMKEDDIAEKKIDFIRKAIKAIDDKELTPLGAYIVIGSLYTTITPKDIKWAKNVLKKRGIK
jgi:hypothetical protein